MRQKNLLAGFMLVLWALPAASAVRAEDHRAFWLWSGVDLQPVLAQADTLYILQGEVRHSRRDLSEGARMVAQGISVPRLARADVWVVFRADTLRWTPEIHQAVLDRTRRWKDGGNRVVGVQIDFDASTRHLDEYVEFLSDLRQRLPREYRLSITGLLDWSSNADPAALNRLKSVIDELVVQTYQGRRSIPDHAAYLPRLGELRLPFRVGLVQGGDWKAPSGLEDNPWFRGYVVFLLNSDTHFSVRARSAAPAASTGTHTPARS